MSDVRYFHDEQNRAVYEVPKAPIISEEYETKTKRRPHPKRRYWVVSATIRVTRADNWFETPGWHYPVQLNPNQTYPAHESREWVERTFTSNYLDAPGVEISEEEYNRLREHYLQIARSNKPKHK